MARQVCEHADRQLCKQFKLVGWVLRPGDRRSAYFSWCEHAVNELEAIAGRPPKDHAVVTTLMGMLQADDSFAAHVARRNSSFLTDHDNWEKLWRAAAAAIFEQYLDEVERGRWP
jgi:hypothetical protein